MMTGIRISYFVLLALLGVAIAEVIQEIKICDNNGNKKCEIHEVRVKPCAEASENKPCKVKKGHYASVEFDFTPQVAANNLETMAYWVQDKDLDLPFMGMNTTGCAYTTCPTEAGKKQTFTYKIKIAKSYPARIYDVKWILKDETDLQCCFIFPIKIVK